MKFLRSALVLVLIIAVFGAAMFGLNFYTGPRIEANRAGEALAPLLAVMPDGAVFDGDALIYDAADAAASSLTGVGPQVLKIYREANGTGYAVQCQTVDNYTSEPMELTFGVDADGKICGVQVDKYTDSIDVRTKDEGFLPSFVGQDSTLADVGLVAGCTFSSSSIRNAVEAGMQSLIGNGLVSAGVKSPAQLLTELIPAVAPGMAKDGVLKAAQLEAPDGLEIVYQADNGTGFAYIMNDADNSFLAVVNAMGECAVYDVDGNNVTEAHADLASEAQADAAARQQDFSADGEKKLGKMFKDAAQITPLRLNTFGTVVYAASFQSEGADYTLFYCRPIGFDQTSLYVVLDENGAIAKLDAKQLFFETDYFPVDDTVDQPAYKSGFNGMAADSFSADAGMISGATMTSNAVRQAITDSFAAFAQLQNGGK